MRKIITRILTLALIMTLTSFAANAQVKSLEKYADMKNVTYVYISKAMIGMAQKMSAPSVPGMEMKKVMPKLTGIQIISSDNKSANAKLKAEVADIIKKEKYEVLMQVDDDGEKVRIYLHEGKTQSAIIMLTEAEKEVTIIAFTGKFSLDDVKGMIDVPSDDD